MSTIKVGGGRIDAQGRHHAMAEREVDIPEGFGALVERAFRRQDPDDLAAVFKVWAGVAKTKETDDGNP